MALTIVGLGGSLARESTSRAALQGALEGAAAAGAETRLLDLREIDLPLYNPNADESTEAAAELIDSCYLANGLIWSSPLYQGTISGALKNALDWLHALGKARPALPTRQGDRPDQRRRRHAGAAGDQHDGVRRARASRVGGAVCRPGRVSRARLRQGGTDPRSGGWATAEDARRRGRARRGTIRCRPIASTARPNVITQPRGLRLHKTRETMALV